MNKLIYLALAAACFSMAGCSNDDAPNVDRTTDDDWISEDGRVVIQLGGLDGANASSAITRSPILDNGSNFFYTSPTPEGTYNTMGIYVLAPQGDWSTGGNEAMLLNNIEGIGINSSKTTAFGAINDDVKKISLRTVNETKWGGVYYYPMVSKYNYTFYGYAPYQSDDNNKVTPTKHQITFNNFDGSQDIMYATAIAPTVSTGAIWINSSYEENPTNLNGYNAKYIRQLKYHKELNDAATEAGKVQKEGNHPWVPNLEFTHKLTWLKFAVVAAREQSIADKNAATELKVKNIKILNHGNTATLDILTGALSFSGTETLSMKKYEDGEYTDADATGEYNPEATESTVRGYLLVNPSATYKVQLTVVPKSNEAGVTPPEQTFDVELKLSDGSFQPGKSYLIKLGIYAMQEVEATASVIAWGDDTIVEFPVE